MKGDFSRFTFDPKNRYSRVLMQQGRVQLDADWNEQLDISAYRTETEISDFIGQSGAPESPMDSTGQSTSFRITANQNEISIGLGRYYVEGMLFENAEEVSFAKQPDKPEAILEANTGIYLAYLDVWQHHITALEVPTIREAALGGADTTTRLKNVWQVKLHKLGELERKTEILNEVNKYTASTWHPTWEAAISGGELMAYHTSGAIAENQLYRVEIHQGNEANKTTASGQVSFKWSRDNGAIAAQVEAMHDTTIKIRPFSQDPQLAFPVGTLVEVSNETRVLLGQPGLLATVQTIQGNQLTVEWSPSNPNQPGNLEHPIIRRWDSKGAIKIGSSSTVHDLEQSIKVSFTAERRYKTGDYWLIPARALTGNIEWLNKPQPPHGIKHRYCSLALLERTTNGFVVLADCRSIFKPITSGLLSKAGDTMTGSLTINQNLNVLGNADISTITPRRNLAIHGNIEARASSKIKFFNQRNSRYTEVGNGAADNNEYNFWIRSSDDDEDRNHVYGYFFDAKTGKVGIHTTNPAETLSINGTLAVSGASTFTGNLSVGGALRVTGISALNGNLSVDGLLSVTGASTFTENLSVGGALRVTGISTLNGDLSVDGLLRVTGASTFTNKLTVNSQLEIKGNPDKIGLVVDPQSRVGVATKSPQSQLEVGGDLQAEANNQSLTALCIKSTFNNNGKTGIKHNGLIIENGNVGLGIPNPEAYTNARLVAKSTTNNGGNTKTNTESVLSLARDGVSGESWPNIVDFRIGRYDDGLTSSDSNKGNLRLRSRTQLDVVLSHGNFDASTSERNQNIMTLRSDGNVGIGTIEPQAKLDVAGTIKAHGYSTQIHTGGGLTASEANIYSLPPGYVYPPAPESQTNYSRNRGVWQPFPNLEEQFELSADATVIIFYQISMYGGNKYIVTRIKVDEKEVSRIICGNASYWGTSDLWIGRLSQGRHIAKIEFRTDLYSATNHPAKTEVVLGNEYAYDNRRLQVLVLGA